MGTNRCGYVHDVEGVSDIGPVCCWRSVREDDDRCVWHTERSVGRDEYERHRPTAGERLDGAQLDQAPFSGVGWLADCVLIGADFTNATLNHADLSGVDLRQAVFRDLNAKGASFEGANLHDASFTVADLRGASFRDAKLYRMDITDGRVDAETQFDTIASYERDIRKGETSDAVQASFTAATWVYRELQRLFRSNAMPRRVRSYYLKEMDLRRRMAWFNSEYLRALYLESSRVVMRYGTSPWRVLGTSFVLIGICALIYPVTGGIREIAGERTITYQIEDPEAAPVPYLVQAVFKSLYFSVVTFSSLGYGDIQPIGSWARVVASVETLLGTLLMALLVFVLTQRHP